MKEYNFPIGKGLVKDLVKVQAQCTMGDEFLQSYQVSSIVNRVIEMLRSK